MEEREQQWLLDEKYNGVPNDAYTADCARLAEGEPLAYVIGHTPFLACTIHLDSRPLIPRVETEFWVAAAIDQLRQSTHTTPHVLDLCAGSGCIGVAIAHALPNTRITFAEIAAQHVPTIKKNIQSNCLTPEIHTIVQSDLFTHCSGVYDTIVTNPPYINPAANTVAPDVVRHEPAQALFGGTDGTEYITRIITTARPFLTQTGTLWIEHEPAHCSMIAEHAQAHGFTTTTHTDQYGVYRYSVLSVAQ